MKTDFSQRISNFQAKEIRKALNSQPELWTEFACTIWGRIHCVDYIEPTDNETKEWLLFSGADNDVMPAYSAWTIFLKADVPSLIRRGNLSYEEMHAILKIIKDIRDWPLVEE